MSRMPHYQSTDPAKAAERAAEVAPCQVTVWRAAGGHLSFAVDDVGRARGDGAAELDARYVDAGEGPESILAWFKETADRY